MLSFNDYKRDNLKQAASGKCKTTRVSRNCFPILRYTSLPCSKPNFLKKMLIALLNAAHKNMKATRRETWT